MTTSGASSRPSAPAVELDAVTVRAGGRLLLRGISVSVSPGEMLLVTGPNGAGKTTLLRAANGLQPADGGSVRIFGTPLTGRTGPALRRTIGYVPQVLEADRRCPATAGEVVLMGRYGRLGLLARPGREDRERARAAAEAVGVERLADVPFGELSGGERKRVLIARALAQEPQILLLDEVFAWLDRSAETETLARLLEYRRKNRTALIVVTHEPEVFAAADGRVLRLENGAAAGGAA